MIYLTKIEDGNTYQFRASVVNNGVDIVHGVFYNWSGKYFEGCGDNNSAQQRQKDLINERLEEGSASRIWKYWHHTYNV